MCSHYPKGNPSQKGLTSVRSTNIWLISISDHNSSHTNFWHGLPQASYLKRTPSTQICMFLSTSRKHCSSINNNTTLLVENNVCHFQTLKSFSDLVLTCKYQRYFDKATSLSQNWLYLQVHIKHVFKRIFFFPFLFLHCLFK